MIILSVCHAGVITRQVHRTTSSFTGLGFLNVIYYLIYKVHNLQGYQDCSELVLQLMMEGGGRSNQL